MSDSHTTTTPTAADDTAASSGIQRRDFLRIASVGAGALLVGACVEERDKTVPRGINPPKKSWGGSGAGHVIVIGGGAWGGWTAHHLRQRGARVTLVDAYGSGNSRASSGDETRGIRSSYGDRTTGEHWTHWARVAIERWQRFDDEHAREFGTKFFHRTGDILMRTENEPFVTKTLEHWKNLKVPHEILSVDEVRKRWPVFNTDDITVAAYEPDAGVVRARYATQAVAMIAERHGVQRVVGRARPGKIVNGKMDGVILEDGTTLRGDAYVFACGPWLRKVFPEFMANRMRVPLGYVCYYGVPEGDQRFSYPNMPSWNFTGVTGWPTLPVDSRGFRSRGSLAAPPAGGAGAAAGAQANNGTGSRGNSPSAQGTAGAGARGNGAGTQGASGANGARTGERNATQASQGQQGRQAAPAADPMQQDPDTSVRWATPERLEGSRRFIERRFPLLATAPLLETRCCHYDISVNRDFIVDHHPQASNAWIAGAGQAEGFKFGPIVGEYIAQRVLGDDGDPGIAAMFKMPTEEYEAPTAAPTATTGAGMPVSR